MARRTRGDANSAEPDTIQGAPLEPIRIVERELTRPDGTKVVVEVPVYPPFRLLDRERASGRTPTTRKRSADAGRPKRSGGAKG